MAAASRPLPQIYPRPAWVEHDPLSIWEIQLEAAREAVSLSRVRPQEVAAIGIPVAGCAEDQRAALFGQACLEPGMAKNTPSSGCGTGWARWSPRPWPGRYLTTWSAG
ncbi:MAG: hypothetical protein H5U04_03665 [Firmicutes bacterium]|nr:hypothetical protein [Bacillota bacterium]